MLHDAMHGGRKRKEGIRITDNPPGSARVVSRRLVIIYHEKKKKMSLTRVIMRGGYAWNSEPCRHRITIVWLLEPCTAPLKVMKSIFPNSPEKLVSVRTYKCAQVQSYSHAPH